MESRGAHRRKPALRGRNGRSKAPISTTASAEPAPQARPSAHKAPWARATPRRSGLIGTSTSPSARSEEVTAVTEATAPSVPVHQARAAYHGPTSVSPLRASAKERSRPATAQERTAGAAEPRPAPAGAVASKGASRPTPSSQGASRRPSGGPIATEPAPSAIVTSRPRAPTEEAIAPHGVTDISTEEASRSPTPRASSLTTRPASTAATEAATPCAGSTGPTAATEQDAIAYKRGASCSATTSTAAQAPARPASSIAPSQPSIEEASTAGAMASFSLAGRRATATTRRLTLYRRAGATAALTYGASTRGAAVPAVAEHATHILCARFATGPGPASPWRAGRATHATCRAPAAGGRRKSGGRSGVGPIALHLGGPIVMAPLGSEAWPSRRAMRSTRSEASVEGHSSRRRG